MQCTSSATFKPNMSVQNPIQTNQTDQINLIQFQLDWMLILECSKQIKIELIQLCFFYNRFGF